MRACPAAGASARAPRARISSTLQWSNAFPRHLAGRGGDTDPALLERWAGRGGRAGELGRAIASGELDVLLIPVNLGNRHWTLGVVNFERRRFEYYDSCPTPAGIGEQAKMAMQFGSKQGLF